MKALPGTSARSYFIGLDVGGTKIEALIADRARRIHAQVNLPTDTSSDAATVASIIRAIEQVLVKAGFEPQQLAAVGVGIPGQIRAGIVKHAVNLNLESFPLAERLAAQFGVPIVLENDSRAAALGAYLYFHDREPIESLAYLSVGTGIAAGLVLGGKIYRGSNGMAGEIGHASVEPKGLRCNCGAYGCLETVAAGPAIALQASQAVAAGQDTRLQTAEPITAKSVYEAARLNDSVARQIVQKASAYLARAVQWLFMTYDVDQLVIGGGVSHDSDDFLQPILDELHRMRAQSDLLNLLLDDRKVALLPNDYNAGVWGAIALAMRHTSA